MSNLTQDRGDITYQTLNSIWNDVRSSISSVMPQGLLALTDEINLNTMVLTESDPEAAEVQNQNDIPIAFVHKALRITKGGFNYVEDDDFIEIGGWERVDWDTNYNYFDKDYDPEMPDTKKDILDKIRDDDYVSNPNTNNVPSDNIINGYNISYPNYAFNVTRYPPVYFNTNQSVFSYLNVGQLAQQLTNNSARLLIGNNDSEFIDINLNSNSSNQLLANQGKKVSSRTPLQSISLINDKSVMENTYLQLDTGDRIPISIIPKTTLQKALEISRGSEKLTELSRKRELQQVGKVVFDKSTFKVSSYERIVSNSSGQGWFSNGYLGTEEFDGLGFDEWSAGNKRIICQIDFGLDKDLPNAFGNTVDDWFVYDPFYLTDEEHWYDFPEGVTPKIPNCSDDSEFNGITEDISSQADGSRQLFTLSRPYETGTLKVYWNGQRQSDRTITEINSTTFRTSFVPNDSTMLLVDYIPL